MLAKRGIPQLWRQLSNGSLLSSSRGYTTDVPSSGPLQPQKLEDKVAIITGAAGAIGSAAARLFSAHGAQVIIADINEDRGQTLAKEMGAVFRRCDVTIEENVASTVDFAVKKFGKLDILYNNAGAVGNPYDDISDLDMALYDSITNVNVRAVVLGIKHAARVMIPAKQGCILTTGSSAGFVTGFTLPLIYNINKSNIPGLTKVCAYHLGKHGIRVNAIHPGNTPTDMYIQVCQKLGWATDLPTIVEEFAERSHLRGTANSPEAIAKAALFLCSSDSSYVTGENMVVDGGLSNVMDPSPYDLEDIVTRKLKK